MRREFVVWFCILHTSFGRYCAESERPRTTCGDLSVFFCFVMSFLFSVYNPWGYEDDET